MKPLRIAALLLLALLLCTPAFAQESVVGIVDKAPKEMESEHPRYTQCQLGSVCADAFRAAAQADVALVQLGDLGENLYQGQVTEEEIRSVLPHGRELAAAQVTPKQLFGFLEQAVSAVVLDLTTEQVDEEASYYDGFCHVSGITLRYDVSAPLGERVLEVKLPDGTLLSREDEDTLLTLCTTLFALEGGYGLPVIPAEPLGITQTDALADYVSRHGNLPEDDQKRITVVGARSGTIIGGLSREVVLVCVLLLCASLAVSRMKLNNYRDEYGNVK